MDPRTQIGGTGYWDEWIKFSQEKIERDIVLIKEAPANPVYEPQFIFDIAIEYRRLMLRRYSRGDAVTEMAQYFPGLIHAWERSDELAKDVRREYRVESCRDWTFSLSDLNHYNWCFWLVGLALSLEIPDGQWNRLLALIGGEGEDDLLDRIIATRQRGRVIGATTLHAKPYARLLKVIDKPAGQQAGLLREFVDHWYPELARTGNQRLWWYDYGDAEKHPLEMGGYFGRWCIEAVAAAKAFGIDDSLCLDHPYYPGDLIQDGRSPRYPDPETPPPPDMRYIKSSTGTRHGRLYEWISRVLSGSPKRP